MFTKMGIAFAEAATEVVATETGLTLHRGELQLDYAMYHTDDITAAISLIGTANGSVLFALPLASALTIVTRMMGEPITELTTLTQSAIAELSNVITGRAVVKLAARGYTLTISPPMLILGKGTALSTLDLPRLVLPLRTEDNALRLELHLAVRDSNTGPLIAHTGD